MTALFHQHCHRCGRRWEHLVCEPYPCGQRCWQYWHGIPLGSLLCRFTSRRFA